MNNFQTYPEAIELTEFPGIHFPRGLFFDALGTGTYSIFAPAASRVQLCFLIDSKAAPDLLAQGVEVFEEFEIPELRFELIRGEAGIWAGAFRNLKPGLKYGIRAFGDWNPSAGKFFNPQVLLVDPYAKGISCAKELSCANFSHQVDAHLNPVKSDDMLVPADFVAQGEGKTQQLHSLTTQIKSPPTTQRSWVKPWSDTVIYEAHVKGFSINNAKIPAPLRGTYKGLGHEESIKHLKSLNITALELLPIAANFNEPHLERLGLSNYWGYNSVSFFAPNPHLATESARLAGADEVIQEVQEMVQNLHAAGIEVILDVVYNHTAEGDISGPTFNFKGLGGAEYYFNQLTSHDFEFINTTGTGNTLKSDYAPVIELVLDSLRFWAEEIGIDGFRFDLAVSLGRSNTQLQNVNYPNFYPSHPLLSAILQDPVLRSRKLIAEPWDIGFDGWQTGNFPPPFRQWNDSFRDDVRKFWLGNLVVDDLVLPSQQSGNLVRRLATRITGSQDIFGTTSPLSSINFVVAHDGFTLHDLSAYNQKHNEHNLEANQDGSNHNHSFNFGFEGPAQAGSHLAKVRDRFSRNLLATLFLAAGVPMLSAGDEILRSQLGNNNSYSQDSDLNYLNWDFAETSGEDPQTQRIKTHLEFTKALINLKRSLPQLSPHSFYENISDLRELNNYQSPATPRLAWLNADASLMQHHDWFTNRPYLIYASGYETQLAVVVMNQQAEDLEIDLSWVAKNRAEILLDTSLGEAEFMKVDKKLKVGAHSVVVLQLDE